MVFGVKKCELVCCCLMGSLRLKEKLTNGIVSFMLITQIYFTTSFIFALFNKKKASYVLGGSLNFY